jgi:hypothetical protein
MADNPTLLLAVWSTVLSTALAGLKIWEVSRDRLRLTATYVFSVRPEDGNEVIIQNVSKTPALITYRELMWAHRRLGRTVFERMAGYPHGSDPI